MAKQEFFIFYKSFYEAIKDLPKDIRLEVMTTIIEYALYETLPENLKPFTKGMFSLIKPVIDASKTRRENGKLGGRPRKDAADTTLANIPTAYSMSFADETAQMKGDDKWLDSVCKRFCITTDEAGNRLEQFYHHCEAECADKPHESLSDAKRHFCSWMRKSYQQQVQSLPMEESCHDVPPDYTFNGGFGGMDV